MAEGLIVQQAIYGSVSGRGNYKILAHSPGLDLEEQDAPIRSDGQEALPQ